MDTQYYLDRIGYQGRVTATKEALFALQAAHVLHVPFENLDIHYATAITLDIPSIYRKIVLNRRGGFCYELNGLFYHLLKSIGFEVRMVSGRVYAKDGNYGAEYDHLAIVAQVEGKEYLVDVGFGKFSHHPLEITLDTRLHDAFGVFRFDKAHEDYLRINLIENGSQVPQYLFTLKGREFEEFAGMCTFHQTSQDSHFTAKKLISIVTPNGRKTLTNNQLKITNGNNETITEFEEQFFEAKLKEHFSMEIQQRNNYL